MAVSKMYIYEYLKVVFEPKRHITMLLSATHAALFLTCVLVSISAVPVVSASPFLSGFHLLSLYCRPCSESAAVLLL